jgi:hypothetical protein
MYNTGTYPKFIQWHGRTFPCRVNNEYMALRKTGFLIFQSMFATYRVLLGAAITLAMILMYDCVLLFF